MYMHRMSRDSWVASSTWSPQRRTSGDLWVWSVSGLAFNSWVVAARMRSCEVVTGGVIIRYLFRKECGYGCALDMRIPLKLLNFFGRRCLMVVPAARTVLHRMSRVPRAIRFIDEIVAAGSECDVFHRNRRRLSEIILYR